MTTHLTEAQRTAYQRDGYVLPLPAFGADEARRYRAALESFEARLGMKLTAAGRKYRSRSYLLFGWAQALVRHPAILDTVEDLIGPDILVFTSTWFIKEPGTPHVAGWHQDATHFGLDPNDRHVTAWLALSDASRDSGCMQFVPGSHRRGQLVHGYGLGASVNDAGQWIPEPGDVSTPDDCCLQPGEFSLHNTLTVHRSGPNNATDRRIGIGISYIPTSVRHTGSQRHTAHLVRGTDRYGHFDLDPAPTGDFDARAQAVHDASFASYAANYAEQVARHVAQSAAA
jgi:non-haem Fe2+, alpha-ketoglutarate-dependent halogenase